MGRQLSELLGLTFATYFPCEGGEVEGVLDLAPDEVTEVANQALNQRGQDRQVVGRLKRGREQGLVLQAGVGEWASGRVASGARSVLRSDPLTGTVHLVGG